MTTFQYNGYSYLDTYYLGYDAIAAGTQASNLTGNNSTLTGNSGSNILSDVVL